MGGRTGRYTNIRNKTQGGDSTNENTVQCKYAQSNYSMHIFNNFLCIFFLSFCIKCGFFLEIFLFFTELLFSLFLIASLDFFMVYFRMLSVSSVCVQHYSIIHHHFFFFFLHLYLAAYLSSPQTSKNRNCSLHF